MSDRAPSVVLATQRVAGPHLLVAGDVDDPGAERLRALLADAVAPGVTLTLDLSRVTRLSHPALAVLVGAHRRLRDGGGSLVLATPSASVVRVLRVSGLHRVLTVLPAARPTSTSTLDGSVTGS